MMKNKGTSRKVTENFLKFIDDVRTTRRGKPINSDKKLLSQMDVGDLLVKYFKEDQQRFLTLVKMEFQNE